MMPQLQIPVSSCGLELWRKKQVPINFVVKK
jgi:hypothetical protein